MTEIANKIFCSVRRICRIIATPVKRSPRFFAVIALLGAMTPIAFMLMSGARILTLLLMAAVQSLTLAYLLCWAILAVRNQRVARCLKWLLGGLIFCLAAVDVATMAMTGEPITPDSASLILETNPREASGFIAQYFSWKSAIALLLLVLATVGIYCLATLFSRPLAGETTRKPQASKGLPTPLKPAPPIASIIVLTILLLAGCWRIGSMMKMVGIRDYGELLLWESQGPENPMLMRINQLKFADPLLKWTFIYKELSLQNANLSTWEKTQERALQTSCTPLEGRDFNIIVVIGESMIKAHSSLYGYQLPTNPRLQAERDSNRLVLFSDMMTTANFTTTSLRNMMNLNDLSAGENWWDGVYFPQLLRRGGWNVYHYDNQTVSVNSDTGIARMIYSPFNLKHTYNAVNDSLFEYDGDYLTYVGSRLIPREAAGKKMVIYHLMGQHFPAADRFPGRPRFTAADITADRPWLTDERRQAVADYDSATFYNDSILGAIIDSRRAEPTILLYFSDHGEDCWDLAPLEARNKPMPEDAAWLDRQYHIPFMVWMSDGFIKQQPALVERLQRAADRPGMLDNFGQLILGISGIQTPYYRQERDISNDAYQPRQRITAEGYQL